MVQATNLGYPRIGVRRELKKALEQFWSGDLSEAGLLDQAAALRRQHWQLQQSLGVQHIPSNDFSLYDHVLDTVVLTGATPPRFRRKDGRVDLRTYFAMARGMEAEGTGGEALAPLEMTKWFDTNYHSLVPEFSEDQSFRLSSDKPLAEFVEASTLGIHTRPVLLGPLSFLLLGKRSRKSMATSALLDRLLPVYEELLETLAKAGANWLQIDEPCLAQDLDGDVPALLQRAYGRLGAISPALRLLLAIYFGDAGPYLPTILRLPIAAVHLDLVRAPQQLELALKLAPASLTLSLGLVDGRNVWRTDLDRALAMIERSVQALGKERLLIGPSCSLLHVPVDLTQESDISEELRGCLAFARQKIEEIVLLTRAANEGVAAIADALEAQREAFRRRQVSPSIHNEAVKRRVQEVRGRMPQRKSSFAERRKLQQARLRLPILPTTTIGSFPQTGEVRAARAACKNGKLETDRYEEFLRHEIAQAIRFQEEIGLDVLVHGEFERSDMVEYFAEQLNGFLFTRHGWVQSYGSRCVRPPIIYGDISRPAPITVRWARFAQSLTQRPVKGMLTGPVTMMHWSFVRDDQPLEETCYQLALALHDEVQDLEAAGITVIQIDEPALREGLPLRRSAWSAYLDLAVACFRLTCCDVLDETQIHTHMCYANFTDIIEAIGRMDADVLSLEASRSQMEMLQAFAAHGYPNDVGPGVYDVHSPHIPSVREYREHLTGILQAFPAERVWVNPDCGLKTRRWEEVRPALAHLVAAARIVRALVETSRPDQA
ncbi:MAG TPA: 5-methyltetrahydropteroyltriglutamate--homocysteine S-methyltransferase [Ktedonobacteraceae bacterium]|nr:5-methyltetrahydropteroyltriglutamate--homocysteine S-methyltransferase [Ktedonobacteraceae bacterium]